MHDFLPPPPQGFLGTNHYVLTPRTKRAFHTVLDAANILDAAGNVAGASVGDSGAWLVNPASGRFVDLTANQHRKPLLGSGRARITPFFHSKKATSRDVLLVASDGLFATCTPAAIVAALGGIIWGSMLGVDTQLALVGLKVFPVVILGGLITSTAMNLLLVPVLYLRFGGSVR